MLRKAARERRQLVFQRSLEQQERSIYQRKQALKDALASGTPTHTFQSSTEESKSTPNFLLGKDLPTELRKSALEMRKDLAFDAAQEDPMTSVDYEYERAGIRDPKIVITTSRDPSSKLVQFAKEMRLVFPNSHRINRGNYVVKELAEACRANEVTDLIILHETRGVPDALIVSHFPHGPTAFFTLHSVSLRHDLPNSSSSTVSEQYPHLIFHAFESKLGERIRDVLKYLFPVPKEDATRVMSFVNENDFISFRHHVFAKTGKKEVQLAEVGPRFEMKPYEIRLGTIEHEEADKEWVLSHYTRTAKKRRML
ncbi:snoRNA-binding rRNA-processing protein imp4 [Serendipita sp. 399]|nr:snoRNA-binding rRNA-processing protein imp4 [Serendipita sp. 399]